MAHSAGKNLSAVVLLLVAIAAVAACKRVCLAESSNNVSGECCVFQCWCSTKCTSETVAAASAPTLA
uniref:Uncharacterized protein n=1 Tax=Setaria viridis TaxID=4556 RepID=A0A4U6TIY8_SETVI|nr:hypothetical protein SEVIR_8G241400v2 [Setaria viridis]